MEKLAIKQKTTTSTNLVPALQQLIQRPDLEREIDLVNRYRQEMELSGLDSTGKEILIRYYATLELLELHVDMSKLQLQFKWYDSTRPKESETQNIALEKASVLFNLAALFSHLAKSADTKQACTYFIQSFSVLQFIADNFLNAPGDLSKDHLAMLIKLFRAQAQQCFLEKAIEDKKSSKLICKMAASVCDEYSACVDLYRKGFIDERELQNRLIYFSALACYYKGKAMNQASKYGEGLSYLEKAKRIIKTHSKQYQSLFSDIEAEYEQQLKDNDLVYHDLVPDSNNLPDIERLLLIEEVDLKQILDTVAVKDLFHSVVPQEVTQKSSVYSEEKAKILRYERDLVCSFLEKLDLLASKPDFIQEFSRNESNFKSRVAILEQKIKQANEKVDNAEGILAEAKKLGSVNNGLNSWLQKFRQRANPELPSTKFPALSTNLLDTAPTHTPKDDIVKSRTEIKALLNELESLVKSDDIDALLLVNKFNEERLIEKELKKYQPLCRKIEKCINEFKTDSNDPLEGPFNLFLQSQERVRVLNEEMDKVLRDCDQFVLDCERYLKDQRMSLEKKMEKVDLNEGRKYNPPNYPPPQTQYSQFQPQTQQYHPQHFQPQMFNPYHSIPESQNQVNYQALGQYPTLQPANFQYQGQSRTSTNQMPPRQNSHDAQFSSFPYQSQSMPQNQSLYPQMEGMGYQARDSGYIQGVSYSRPPQAQGSMNQQMRGPEVPPKKETPPQLPPRN